MGVDNGVGRRHPRIHDRIGRRHALIHPFAPLSSSQENQCGLIARDTTVPACWGCLTQACGGVPEGAYPDRGGLSPDFSLACSCLYLTCNLARSYHAADEAAPPWDPLTSGRGRSFSSITSSCCLGRRRLLLFHISFFCLCLLLLRLRLARSSSCCLVQSEVGSCGQDCGKDAGCR